MVHLHCNKTHTHANVNLRERLPARLHRRERARRERMARHDASDEARTNGCGEMSGAWLMGADIGIQ